MCRKAAICVCWKLMALGQPGCPSDCHAQSVMSMTAGSIWGTFPLLRIGLGHFVWQMCTTVEKVMIAKSCCSCGAAVWYSTKAGCRRNQAMCGGKHGEHVSPISFQFVALSVHNFRRVFKCLLWGHILCVGVAVEQNRDPALSGMFKDLTSSPPFRSGCPSPCGWQLSLALEWWSCRPRPFVGLQKQLGVRVACGITSHLHPGRVHCLMTLIRPLLSLLFSGRAFVSSAWWDLEGSSCADNKCQHRVSPVCVSADQKSLSLCPFS